jgi:hypothetical protein
MNTLEARGRLAELTASAIEIVGRLAAGSPVTAANGIEMREILREARDIAYDAGYIGDAAWRALLKTNVYVTTPPTTVDMEFWGDILLDLRDAWTMLTGLTDVVLAEAEAVDA